jgi:hypothetical protein
MTNEENEAFKKKFTFIKKSVKKTYLRKKYGVEVKSKMSLEKTLLL